MPKRQHAGYTLIEIVVALLLFPVGGLALVSTSAVVGRELNANAVREHAGRMAQTRVEMLGAACRVATGGREVLGRIESAWSVEFPDSGHVTVLESVAYPTRRGRRTDSYRVTLPCRR